MKHRYSEQFTSTWPTITSMEFILGLHVKDCEHYTGNFRNSFSLNIILSRFRNKKQNLAGFMITSHHRNAVQYHDLKKYVSIERSPILVKMK
jgi:hypothetical protein